MKFYVTSDFRSFGDGTFMRIPSLADSYFLREETALKECRALVHFCENKGRYKNVQFFKKPVETDSYIVLGSYIWCDNLCYFGVGFEYLIER